MIKKGLNKRIFREVRKANSKYRMVESSDKIAVGLSGGKDSTALLFFMSMLQKYTPVDFDLIPIYLDLGLGADTQSIKDLCSSLELPLIIEETHIAQVVFEARQEKNPCSLCSTLRRGALNRTAKSQGCNKVALGHHADDVVDTMLMSMIFEGRYHLFKPVTYLDRIDITVIRPLIYVTERDIESFIESTDFKIVKNPCPVDGYTMREEMKKLVADIETRFPGARKRILTSIENVDQDSFWQPLH